MSSVYEMLRWLIILIAVVAVLVAIWRDIDDYWD